VDNTKIDNLLMFSHDCLYIWISDVGVEVSHDHVTVLCLLNTIADYIGEENLV
jgi:hypothetical protein